MRSACRFVLASLCFCPLAAPALAEGFADARPGLVGFKIAKKGKNTVNLTSKVPGHAFKGLSREVRGELTLDPAKLDEVAGRISVPFKSLDTGNATRNEHMLSSRWIDAEKNPDAVFVIEGIEKVKRGDSNVKASLKGRFQLHGEEQPVSIPVTMVYVKDKDEKGTRDTLAIRANFTIALSDYGIKDTAVGKKVAEKMKLAVSLQMEASGPPEAASKTAGKGKKKTG